jgi:hypothetical protein
MPPWASPESAAGRGVFQTEISDVSGSLSNRGAAFFRLAGFLSQHFERVGVGAAVTYSLIGVSLLVSLRVPRVGEEFNRGKR